ncbi:MAG: glycosyltransferase family 2 protein [Bacteroidota bacterium]
MQQLSVAIISFNEELNIARCIESVLPVADEIILVDSFSCDKTLEISSRYPVKIIQHTFDGYIEQKNYALSCCTHEYILSLDADEALSEELTASILEIKANAECDGYIMSRLTNYCGKWIHHCGWYPDKKLRIFNRKGKWGGTNPHDKLVLPEGSNVCTLKGDLLHFSYYTMNDHMDQIKKFTEIGANEAWKSGVRSSIFKILYKPVVKFLRDYFLKLGMLDGFFGFVICINSSFATYLKYTRLYILQQEKK